MQKKLLALKIKESDLRAVIGQIEIGSEAFDYYNNVWKNLPEAKKVEIKAGWKRYYNEVGNTRAGLDFRIKVGLMKGRDVSALKQIKPVDHVEKPSGVDPDVMMHEVSRYFSLTNELKRIEKQIKEFGEDKL